MDSLVRTAFLQAADYRVRRGCMSEMLMGAFNTILQAFWPETRDGTYFLMLWVVPSSWRLEVWPAIFYQQLVFLG